MDSVEDVEKRRHIVRGVNRDDEVCVCVRCLREVWGMMRRKGWVWKIWARKRCGMCQQLIELGSWIS